MIPVRPLNTALVGRCDLPVGDQRRRSRPGLAASRRPGPGSELHVSREYEPGDDPRRVDWNASARSASLQVRTTTAEVALDVHLCPSPSASMRFGTEERKHVVGAEALRFIAAIAARRNEQVFLHGIPGRPVRLPVRRGLGLLEGLLVSPPEWTSGGDLLPLLAGLGPARGPSLVAATIDVVTSERELETLRMLAATRDVLVVLVLDPAELDLPDAGALRLGAPGSDHGVLVDTSNARVRAVYRDRVEAHLDGIRRVCRAPGMNLVEVRTDREVEGMLVAQLPRRR